MKYSILIFAFLAVAGCNNSPKPAENAASHDHAHMTEEHKDHTALAQPKDTTAILPGQKVFFVNLKDGQEIKLPYVVKFGVEGMEVVPAMGVEPNKGHHHLVVDGLCVPSNTMVPMQKEAEGCYHFGKGQVKDTLNIKKYPMLTPGKHTLTLQFANGLHMSYGPAMSSTVNIVVK